MSRDEGRLELTWTNKDQCLLAHEDGFYEWLPPSDYRVAEVRLLNDVQTVGELAARRAADNLGGAADVVLSANIDRAGARLVTLVASEQRKFRAKPSYNEVVEIRDFRPVRATDKPHTKDRHGKFVRANAYAGWQRSMFSVVWFDSGTERDLANIVDDDSTVAWWVRLHINDLPILWHSGGRNYNPDFLVIEQDNTHWIVETKMNKDVSTDEVQGKRVAARRWANYVNADDQVKVTWRYLLVSESDVATAKGSWLALKGLGM